MIDEQNWTLKREFRRLSLAAWVVLFAASVPCLAWAQTSTTAESHYAAGRTAMSEQRYDDAIIAFTEALSKRPSSPGNYAIGLAYYAIGLANERKGDLTAALRFYSKVVNDPDTLASLSSAQKRREVLERARSAIARIEAQANAPAVGTLILRGVPAGLEVWVDDVRTALAVDGRMPLPAGEHRVHIVRAGQRVFETTVTLTAGSLQTVEVRVPPVVADSATIRLHVNVSEARVLVGGVDVGPADGRLFTLPTGRSVMRVVAPDHDPQVFQLDLEPGEERELHALLLPTAKVMSPEERATFRQWAWISVGVGGAALVTGFILTGSVDHREDKLREAEQIGEVTAQSRTEVADFVSGATNASYAMYTIAVLGAVSATTLFVMSAPGESPMETSRVSPTLMVMPDTVIVGAFGRF